MNCNPTPTITESISTKTPTAYTSRIPSPPWQNFVKRSEQRWRISLTISRFSPSSPLTCFLGKDAQEDAKMFPCMERRALSYAVYPGRYTNIFCSNFLGEHFTGRQRRSFCQRCFHESPVATRRRPAIRKIFGTSKAEEQKLLFTMDYKPPLGSTFSSTCASCVSMCIVCVNK